LQATRQERPAVPLLAAAACSTSIAEGVMLCRVMLRELLCCVEPRWRQVEFNFNKDK
jgi:hypothetical protein